MRLKLLRRRLTISAPRVAVRSAMPWPLRWALVAIVLGFCGAISLWAFELGKNLAGIDTGDKEELARLRDEIVQMRSEREKVQSILNTSGSLLTAERAAQERLSMQVKTLEAENRALHDDLGFFEKLIPAGGSEAVAIRGLQADLIAPAQMRWQILVIQPIKNAPEFRGRLEMTVAGTLGGQPWTLQVPGGTQALSFRQYRRLEGVIDLPPQAVVQNVSARVLEGSATRAAHSIRVGTAGDMNNR